MRQNISKLGFGFDVLRERGGEILPHECCFSDPKEQPTQNDETQ